MPLLGLQGCQRLGVGAIELLQPVQQLHFLFFLCHALQLGDKALRAGCGHSLSLLRLQR